MTQNFFDVFVTDQQELIARPGARGKLSSPGIAARNTIKQRAAVWLLFLLLAMPVWSGQRVQDVVLVLDNSGSMRKNDPGFLIKNAVKGFVETLDSNVRLAVLIFDQDVNWVVPFTEVNDANKSEILASLDGVKYDGLYTDSRAAMELAADELNRGAQAGAKKIIVFLTDGIVDTGNPKRDEQSAAWLRSDFASAAEDNGIAVIGIAFTENADHALVRALATGTGGTYFSVPGALDLEAMLVQAALFITAMPAAAEPDTESAQDVEAREEAIAGETASGLDALEAEPAALVEEQAAPVGVVVEEAVDVGTGEAQGAGTEQAVALEDEIQIETEPRPLGGIEPEALEVPADTPLELEAVPEARGSVVTGVREAPEQSLSEEASAQDSGSAVTREVQSASGGLRKSEGAKPPAPAASGESMLFYLIGALVVVGIVVLGFLLYSRSRRPAASASAATRVIRTEASASAATRVVRTARQVPEEPMPPAYLEDLDKVTSKPRHTLRARKIVITRTDEIEDATAEHIRIPRETISRRHAAIEYDRGAFWLSDYDSTNGTFQNDHKVSGRQRLRDGDRVRFDEFDFLFVAPESQTSDATVLHRSGSREDEAKTVRMPSKN